MCLVERWTALCRHAGATAQILESYQALLARYAEPPRAYHNLGHVAYCLAEFDLLAADAATPAAVEFALWFHDAVYDTHRADNEQQSADYARETLDALGLPAFIDAVASLILLTRHDETPSSTDGQIIVDVDLAILGAPRQDFNDYEARIRLEYAWVDDTLFWTKRREFLLALSQRPRIFHTPACRARYEAKARQNLRQAIAQAEQRLEQA
ncbi:MAG TPA: N-methyl-D-aspartate receptor NMDAR2C subunit [Armatimonadota bacterium]